VVTTSAFDRWFAGLPADRRNEVKAAQEYLAERGPNLGRPRVDSINGSRVHNMKELRMRGGVRALFAFGPDRRAVMLVGGDKTGSWKSWYRQMVPVAERLYLGHLRNIGKGGHCLSQHGAGPRSAARSR
jgi:hypothetical protein